MKRLNAPHDPKVCATCTRPLDYLTDGDGVSNGRYVHAREEYGQRTHVVIPVDPSEVESVSYMCDFCFAEDAVNWTVVTHPFVIETRVAGESGLAQNFSSLWAACDECADLIKRKRFGALVSRVAKIQFAKRPLPPQGKSVVKTWLNVLYSRVEAEFVTIRPTSVSDAYEGDFAPTD